VFAGGGLGGGGAEAFEGGEAFGGGGHLRLALAGKVGHLGEPDHLPVGGDAGGLEHEA
jgi:hypothetical protein